jgi:hypothetical protein
MNNRIAITSHRLALILVINLLTLAATCTSSLAYETYAGDVDGGCIDCHGAFDDATSPKGTTFPSNSKHEMHRASTSMNTDCSLCHTSPSRTPVYLGSSDGTANNSGLGCSGCHLGPGLREHHYNNGQTLCYDCHTRVAAQPESVKPPYYGTVDTKANNPGNPVPVANTNENWSVGDFLGLDNDGNNLYDARDPAITPYRIAGAAKQGNDIRITWITAGGRKDTVMVAPNVTGPYSNLSTAISIPGVGQVTTNYLHVNAATNALRFYRLSCTP